MSNLSSLKKLAQTTHNQLVDKYPEIASIHSSPTNIDSIDQTVIASIITNKKDSNQMMSHLTSEERSAIYTKLQSIATQKTTLQPEELTYLEQQLSDLYNLPIASEIEGHRLPIASGVVKAVPHFPTTPNNTIHDHQTNFNATLTKKRTFFDWVTTSGKSNNLNLERYGVGLPLYTLKEWQVNPFETAKWFKHRTLLIINPFIQKAFIAGLIDVAPLHIQRYQLTISPELITEGNFWYPNQYGHANIFFIDLPLESISLGAVSQ